MPNKSKSTKKSLKSTTKNLKNGSNYTVVASSTVTSALQIEDMVKKYPNLFSTKAKCEFITKKVMNTITQRQVLNPVTATYDNLFEPVEYFGTRCNKCDEAEAMELIAKIVNIMFKEGVVTGVLAPPVGVDLHVTGLGLPEMCIVFYFAIDHNHVDRVKARFRAFAINEGAIPEKLEHLKRLVYDWEFTEELEERLDVV